MRPVSIRELSGRVIDEAAQKGEVLGITNERRLCAVLIPVRQKWVDQLVEHNLSRILHAVDLGMKDEANKEEGTPLDDALDAVSR